MNDSNNVATPLASLQKTQPMFEMGS